MKRVVLIGVGLVCTVLPLRAQTLDPTLEQAAQHGDLGALQPLFSRKTQTSIHAIAGALPR